MFDLAELRAFAKVAETRSITAAARALRLPKSSISRALARLEESLRVRLLQRTTRSVSLTEAGAEFHRHCIRILDDVAEAEALMSELQSTPRGRLRISAPIAFGQTFLGSLVGHFVRDHPEVTISLELESRRSNVVGEEVDIAIRVGRLEDSSLVARRLCTVEMRLCATPELIRRAGLTEGLGSPLNATVATGTSTRRSWHLVEAAGREREFPISPVVEVNDPISLRQVILTGAAVGWLPRFLCAADLAEGRLVEVPFGSWRAPPADVHALFPSRQSLSPKVRLFLEHLSATLPRIMGGT